MKSTVIKILISVVCILAVIGLFFFGDRVFPTEGTSGDDSQTDGIYQDAFRFDPEELRYDGTGELDLLEGVSLEGYTAQDLKTMVFTRIYKGNTLSEKVVQYTAETENGKVRSTRPLKLYQYKGPQIFIPDEMPTVTRKLADKFGDLLAVKSGYAIDDGFGNDVRDHAEIRYEQDAKKSDLLHYTISLENMFGDSHAAKVDVTLSEEPAYLELAESEVTLKKGESFDPAKYVVRGELADGSDARNAIICRGDVDTSKTGTYAVEYNLEDEKLILYVHVL